MENTLVNKIAILGEVWGDHRTEAEYAELVEWHDFTLPLAWAIQHGLATHTEDGLKFIEGAYSDLLKVLEIEDALYIEYEDLFGSEE